MNVCLILGCDGQIGSFVATVAVSMLGFSARGRFRAASPSSHSVVGTSGIASSIIISAIEHLIIPSVIRVLMFFFAAGDFSFSTLEGQRIGVSRKVHIDNGGAVAFHDDVLIGLIGIEGEMRDGLRLTEGTSVYDFSGCGIYFSGVIVAIVIVIGVFGPINDGIGSVGGLPLRLIL